MAERRLGEREQGHIIEHVASYSLTVDALEDFDHLKRSSRP